MSDERAFPQSFADLAERSTPRRGPPRLTVRFVRRWREYFAGDCAVFPARTARRLVTEGRAEAVDMGDPANMPANPVFALRMPVPIEARQRSKDDDEG